jgi:hypothetical protein
MLSMPARELRHPVALVVALKADHRTPHPSPANHIS